MAQRSIRSFFSASALKVPESNISQVICDQSADRRNKIVKHSINNLISNEHVDSNNTQLNVKKGRFHVINSDSDSDNTLSHEYSEQSKGKQFSDLSKTTLVSVSSSDSITQFSSETINNSLGNNKTKSHALNFDPSKDDYHILNDATWSEDESVPYSALVSTFDCIEAESGRLRTINILCNFMRSVIALSPRDLSPCVYLCLNQLAPAYKGVELGVGDTVILRALAQATGHSQDKLKSQLSKLSDMGQLATSCKLAQRVLYQPKSLTVSNVYDSFNQIASMSGHSVMGKKIAKINSLIVACQHLESKYLVRGLSGKLRVGLAEQSVLQALGQAFSLTTRHTGELVLNALHDFSSDSKKKHMDNVCSAIKAAFCEYPSYDALIPNLLRYNPVDILTYCHITPGVPIRPMLAQPTKGVSEIMSRFDSRQFTCEFKYDGERAQVHVLENGDVRVFSRNLLDQTSKYPDIVNRFRKCLCKNTRSCIIDTEAVAWDIEKGQILPFQVLSTRKKKDASAEMIKIQIKLFAFDILYLNDESLIGQPFYERRVLLRDMFQPVANEFSFVPSIDSNDVDDIALFLEQSISAKCEGLMVKSLHKDATYEISKRSRSWLKLKKDYLDGVGDTIDVVVIGAYFGKGKRSGQYGGFLVACYDTDNEEFQSICKLGTGFSDDDLESHTTSLKEHIIPSAKPYYRYSIEADVWFEPVQVWEVKCADMSISPVHTAAIGLVDQQKGVSLRFPRYIRMRNDKSAEQATSANQIASMYRSQMTGVHANQAEADVDDDEIE